LNELNGVEGTTAAVALVASSILIGASVARIGKKTNSRYNEAAMRADAFNESVSKESVFMYH